MSRVVLSITPTESFYNAMTSVARVQRGSQSSFFTSQASQILEHPAPIIPPQLARTNLPSPFRRDQPTPAPLAFLHRPFNLHRQRLPRSATVLASHTGFDELLTVGWNVALAARLGADVDNTACVKGYKGDPERMIGFVGGFDGGRSAKEVVRRVLGEFDLRKPESAGATTVMKIETELSDAPMTVERNVENEPQVYDFSSSVPHSADFITNAPTAQAPATSEIIPQSYPSALSEPVTALAIMNAFDPDTVIRAIFAAAELGLVEIKSAVEKDAALVTDWVNTTSTEFEGTTAEVPNRDTSTTSDTTTTSASHYDPIANQANTMSSTTLPATTTFSLLSTSTGPQKPCRPPKKQKPLPPPPQPIPKITNGRLLCLTGAARPPGLQAAREAGMLVVCVGHERCEEWGIRYLGGRIREKWFGLEVVEVFGPEVKVERVARGMGGVNSMDGVVRGGR